MDVVLLMGGAGLALIGWVWILIAAVTESIPWAVGIFFINPLALVYGVLKWEELKAPTVLYAVGLGAYVLGRVLAGG